MLTNKKWNPINHKKWNPIMNKKWNPITHKKWNPITNKKWNPIMNKKWNPINNPKNNFARFIDRRLANVASFKVIFSAGVLVSCPVCAGNAIISSSHSGITFSMRGVEVCEITHFKCRTTCEDGRCSTLVRDDYFISQSNFCLLSSYDYISIGPYFRFCKILVSYFFDLHYYRGLPISDICSFFNETIGFGAGKVLSTAGFLKLNDVLSERVLANVEDGV